MLVNDKLVFDRGQKVILDLVDIKDFTFKNKNIWSVLFLLIFSCVRRSICILMINLATIAALARYHNVNKKIPAAGTNRPYVCALWSKNLQTKKRHGDIFLVNFVFWTYQTQIENNNASLVLHFIATAVVYISIKFYTHQ